MTRVHHRDCVVGVEVAILSTKLRGGQLIMRKLWHGKLFTGLKGNQSTKHEKARRLRCIEHYGGKCACCGESRYEFLAIDHINGDGNEHRKKIGNGSCIVGWLIKNNFPEGFRILCHNCNASFGLYGYCPHQKERENESSL